MRRLSVRSVAFAVCLSAVGASGHAAPSPKMLLELADLSSVAMSPDGRRAAFQQEQASVERNTYSVTWYVTAVDGSTPVRKIADGGEPLRLDYGGSISEPPQWSASSQWIYYRALLGGQVQVWRAAVDGSRTEQVTHDPSDVNWFSLSPDGARLIYSVGASRADIERAEQDEYDRGIRIDHTIPLGQGLYHSAYLNGRLASVRFTGDWSGRGGLLADRPARQQIVDLSNLAVRDATPADQSAFGAVMPVLDMKAAPTDPDGLNVRVRSTSSGKIAYLVLEGDHMRLRVTTSAETPSFVECAAPACQNVTITAIAWRPGQDQVVFTTSDPGRGRAQSLLLWDLASDAVRRVAQADGLISGGHGSSLGESCAIGALAAVCVTASADTPPRLERIDLATGERRVLYDPNQDLAQAVGPRAEFLSWTDAKGRTFSGQLFPPASTRPGQAAPLFITYYGCAGYLRGGVGDEWPLAGLAGAGIAALCINEPPTDRLNPDQLSRYEAAMSGVEAIVAELGRRGIVDPHRVGMGGLSFGSEVTMWAAMKTDLLAAASMTSPSVTPTYFRFHSLQGPGWRKNLKRAWGLGSPEETPERWRLLSPAFNLDRIHAPLLLQMPEQEYLEASDYFAPLANSATPAEMFVFPNEPHVKFQPRHKLAAYERNLDWFRFWLQGYVDPDPLKADQYARWEAMRARAAAAGQHPGQGRTTG